MDLRKANFTQTIDAGILDKKLNGLKWISCLNPNVPNKEVLNLKESINLIKDDERIKGIVTEYQFISVILSTYDYSPTQVWFMNHVVNLEKDSKFFKSYKNLLINSIKHNNIKIIYIINPVNKSNLYNYVNEECFDEEKITEILIGYELKNCKEING